MKYRIRSWWQLQIIIARVNIFTLPSAWSASAWMEACSQWLYKHSTSKGETCSSNRSRENRLTPKGSVSFPVVTRYIYLRQRTTDKWSRPWQWPTVRSEEQKRGNSCTYIARKPSLPLVQNRKHNFQLVLRQRARPMHTLQQLTLLLSIVALVLLITDHSQDRRWCVVFKHSVWEAILEAAFCHWTLGVYIGSVYCQYVQGIIS